MNKVQALPFEATTSLHHDFKAARGAMNELESLAGYVVRNAVAAGLTVPLFKELYQQLKTWNTDNKRPE